ncbi:MAG: hypothetical protein ACK4HV_07185 [Parachlamydiaceae bacterium]
MCLNISAISNLNNYFNDCVVNERVCPIPIESEFESSCSWQRKNDIKCLVAGGCTFAGGVVSTLGGWTWIITGAAMSAIGNLASYRYSRMTQEIIDHDAHVKLLFEERASILSRIKELEEEKKAKTQSEEELIDRILKLERIIDKLNAPSSKDA